MSNFCHVLNAFSLFCVISHSLNFICRRFRTLCLFHLHRRIGVKWVILHLSAYEDGTECSETSAYKIWTLGNYPEESIQLLTFLTSNCEWNTELFERYYLIVVARNVTAKTALECMLGARDDSSFTDSWKGDLCKYAI